ncbi:MAG: hypothetical protein K2X82_08390 [Gemmataceae bacterium]|nr:hypothetical protein [Gemmataceae bacterium]
MIGAFVIVRTYSAGVHCGTLIEQAGTAARLANARRIVRDRIAPGTAIPIEPDGSADTPHLVGEQGYHVFKNGGRVSHPGAARRAGHKIRYVRSTLAVAVGLGWLVKQLKRL